MITWVCSHAHSTKSISGGGEGMEQLKKLLSILTGLIIALTLLILAFKV